MDHATNDNSKGAVAQKTTRNSKEATQVLFLDDNALSHRINAACGLVQSYDWKPLINAAYSLELATSE